MSQHWAQFDPKYLDSAATRRAYAMRPWWTLPLLILAALLWGVQ